MTSAKGMLRKVRRRLRGTPKGRPPARLSGLEGQSLYRSDGTLVPLARALNDMFIRIERIEAKLDRLLGNAVTPPSRADEPATRTFSLELPRPPAQSRVSRSAPRRLTMTADWSMYVPRHLGKVGFAGYEPVALPYFLAALESAGDGAVLDVGLNVGPYALVSRAFSDREVVGFEPTPDLARVARRCGTDNGLAYTVEELALGSENGTATLYLSDSTDSSNSLNPTFRANSFILKVPLETLDSYVTRTGVKPGLLKVDTETTEPAVLAGAVETVRVHRPWIFCEVLPGQTPDELATVIQDWGYTWYNLDGPGPLEPRDRIVGNPGFDNYMWLFTPEPPQDAFWSLAQAWHEALAATAPEG